MEVGGRGSTYVKGRTGERGGGGQPVGRGRGGASGGEASRGSVPTPAEQEERLRETQASLEFRLHAAEVAEANSRIEENWLREEHEVAKTLLQQARRREQKAREAAEDARRRAGRSQDAAKGELTDLMRRLIAFEKEEQQFNRQQAECKAELDALVIGQAAAMAKCDELSVEVGTLEAAALADGARALDLEARVKLAEERNAKERDLVQQMRQEVKHWEHEEKAAARDHTEAARLRQLSAAAEASALLWRSAASALGVAVGCAAVYRLLAPLLF